MRKLLLFLPLFMCLFVQTQEVLTYCNDGENYSFQISKDEYYITFEVSNKESIKSLARKFTELSNNTAVIKTEVTGLDFNSRKAEVAKARERVVGNIRS